MDTKTKNVPLSKGDSQGVKKPHRIQILLFKIRVWYLTNKARYHAVKNILTHKRFCGIGVPTAYMENMGSFLTKSKEEQDHIRQTRNANNLAGQYVFVVPQDLNGIQRTIKRLQTIEKSLVHTSKHHNGISKKNLKKGGKQ